MSSTTPSSCYPIPISIQAEQLEARRLLAADSGGWLLQLNDGALVTSFSESLQLTVDSQVRVLSNGWVVRPTENSPANWDASLQQNPLVAQFYELELRERPKRLTFDDDFYDDQWHLKNTGQTGGTVGADVNVEPAWDSVLGTGVVIGIVDDGLQHDHPDLSPNYVAALSHDYFDGDSDPSPEFFDDHGTAVAGVAAARGGNSIGVSGAAPNASLAGLRLTSGGVTDAQESNALSHMPNDIDIYNNSWGPPDDGRLEEPGPLTLAALEAGATTGRNGLGNIYVWAAGNGLENDDNANYDGYANSIYTIAVAAIDHDGEQSYYSEPGANIFVAAPSSGDIVGITTTDRTGGSGYASGDYTDDFGGTSSATPLVAGVIGLMLEANPDLTGADVRHILAQTAVQNDPSDSEWVTNGAGFPVSHKYGFGTLDAAAAVNAAATWTTVGPHLTLNSGVLNVATSIPDNNSTGLTQSLEITDDIRLEQIEIVFDADHTFRGDLRVVLTAPSGVESTLAEAHGDGGDDFPNWVFSSIQHWGESSEGTWTLHVSDRSPVFRGTWNSWQLRLNGIDDVAPTVILEAPETTLDATPEVTVTATDNVQLVDGTPIFLDVDLNNDGDFEDDGEAGYATSTLVSGSSTFEVTPELMSGDYAFRARVFDGVGNEGTSNIELTSIGGTDVLILSAAADGQATLILTYEIKRGVVEPFDVSFVRSTDSVPDIADTIVSTLALTESDDLQPGVHVRSLTIGGDADELPLPGFGAADSSIDYVLFAVADLADLLDEGDADPLLEDNSAPVVGAYHDPGGDLMIFGGTGDDQVVLATDHESVSLELNGALSTYLSTDVAQVRLRTGPGNDVASAALLVTDLVAWGGEGDDRLTGGLGADSVMGGAGNDTLSATSGNDLLVGGRDHDRYLFDADETLGSVSIDESQGGVDMVNFAPTTAAAVSLDLAIGTAQVVNAQLTLTLGGNRAIEKAIGGSQGDSLWGNALPNSLIGGPGDDILGGREGNDTYYFDADVALGSDSLEEDADGGRDTIDFAGTSALGIRFDLSVASQSPHPNLVLQLSNPEHFENARGTRRADTLLGNAGRNRLEGLNGDDAIDGGPGNDTYAFDTDGPLGTDTLQDSSGVDTLYFGATQILEVGVNLAEAAAQAVNANLTLVLGDANRFENAVGGSQSDTLWGSALNNVLTGNGGNDILIGDAGRDLLSGNAGDDSLAGGPGDDRYRFDADQPLGTDSIDESDGGVDMLNFAGTAQPVAIDLSNPAEQVVNAQLRLILGSDHWMERAVGGSGSDTLTGNSLDNLLHGGPGDDTLAGGLGDDTYRFAAHLPSGADTLIENAAEGFDWLDFQLTIGQGILLDLSETASQVVTPTLSVALSSAAGFEHVVGTDESDQISGNAEPNLLVGRGGDDQLTGLGARDLLFGGLGADVLTGGTAEDLLIAGTTSHDLDPVALTEIVDEWTSGNNYVTRTTNLRAALLVTGATVLEDLADDSLTGNANRDWFFGQLTEVLDQATSEDVDVL